MKIASTIIIWILFAVMCACDYKEPMVQMREVITTISHTPDNILADGVSRAKIEVTLPDETMNSKRSVTLTTSIGIFDGSDKNTVTLDAVNYGASKVAYAFLKSPQEAGIATVTINVHNYIAEHTIEFIKALPESIALTSDKIYIKPSPEGEVALTVQVLRNKGIPTTGHDVNLTVTDPQGREVGAFRNKSIKSDATGKAISYYSITDTTYQGKQLKVKTTTIGANGQLLADSLNLSILKL